MFTSEGVYAQLINNFTIQKPFAISALFYEFKRFAESIGFCQQNDAGFVHTRSIFSNMREAAQTHIYRGRDIFFTISISNCGSTRV